MWRLRWLDLLPEALGGAVVLTGGLVEAHHTHVAGAANAGMPLAVVVCTTAVALARRLPSAALALSLVAAVLHLGPGVPVLLVESAYCVVMFGAARWGRPATCVAALGVLAVGAGAALVLLDQRSVSSVSAYLPLPVLQAITRSGRAWQLAAAATVAAVLLVPWLVGLVLRLVAGAERARLETEQARRIAVLEEQRARLAHDVHDVVGHSLAVILAQAESGQYATDLETLKRTVATIATSARASLQDVRQVLHSGQGRNGTLRELVDGVRTSGHDVDETVSGRRGRSRRTWRPWRTASCRRCSPTRCGTAAATTRSASPRSGATGSSCRSATPRTARRSRGPDTDWRACADGWSPSAATSRSRPASGSP